jgi:hypothetical protein
MKTSAQLWEEYKPKLAAAKKLDQKEASLVFLVQPVKVGRFQVAPFSIRRLLFLDAVESPFIGGSSPIGRESVLRALWVLSPKFTPSIFLGRFFAFKYFWIKWEWYAEELAELISESMELMSQGARSDDADENSVLWVSSMVDVFASQYHWPLDQILDVPLLVTSSLGSAMGRRMEASSGKGAKNPLFSRHADACKKQYLAESNKAAERSRAHG